jgi:cytochrome P450
VTAGPAGSPADDAAAPTAYPFPARDGVAPDPAYARLRGAPHPVVLDGGRPAWLATRTADVRTVHTDPRFSRAEAAGGAAPTAGLAPPAGSLLALDPPDHTRVRGLVAGAFSARRVAAMRPGVRAAAEALLDALPGDRPVDLVAHYARPLSVRVVGDLLGVPAADHGRFADWSDALLSTHPGAAEEIGRARGALVRYLGEQLARRAADPADDLLSHLAAQGDRATPHELVMLAMAVLVAGHETTANHLGSSLLLVLGDPERAAALRAAPDAVPATVEELLRLVVLGAVGGFPRVATDDVDLGGAAVRRGDVVIAALGAANRDPAAFPPDPDALRPGRPAGSTHVAFGAGPHHCLGAALARIELAEGLSAVLRTRPAATPEPSAGTRWHRDSLVRGLVDLPVRLGPRSTPAPAGQEGTHP